MNHGHRSFISFEVRSSSTPGICLSIANQPRWRNFRYLIDYHESNETNEEDNIIGWEGGKPYKGSFSAFTSLSFKYGEEMTDSPFSAGCSTRQHGHGHATSCWHPLRRALRSHGILRIPSTLPRPDFLFVYWFFFGPANCLEGLHSPQSWTWIYSRVATQLMKFNFFLLI